MAEWCLERGVAVWAYCLMPNHIHLIAVPQSEDALARGIGEAHRRHTRRINFREKWRGYLWQGRFASFVMDSAAQLAEKLDQFMASVEARQPAQKHWWQIWR